MRIRTQSRPVRAGIGALVTAIAVLAAGAGSAVADLSSSFHWSSSGPLVNPVPDAGHAAVAFKDPSVVRYGGRWLVFGSTADAQGNAGLVFTSFGDWNRAYTAPQSFLDQSAIGSGYHAAPQVFYFAPQRKWYLIYQSGLPTYSTSSDPTDPKSWSAPAPLMAMPDEVTQNISGGYWVHFSVICDERNCYLFSADDNGHIYRSVTSLSAFPDGFGDTRMVLADGNKFNLFEGTKVYKVKGAAQYLLTVEAFGSSGGRELRSWVSDRLDGDWVPLADPFASTAQTTFAGAPWTADISHGELIRDGVDQTMTIDPGCLQLLYQGKPANLPGQFPYNQTPWRLGLLTENSAGAPCNADDGTAPPAAPVP